MKAYDRVSSLFFTFLAIAICVESIRLGPGSLVNPGPGLIPLGCGLILGMIGLIVFTRTLKGLPQAREAFWGAGTNKWKAILSLLSLLSYGLLLDFLGFILVTFIWMNFLCRWIGGMGWKGAIFTSFITTLGTYVLFDRILGMQFPRGMLLF